MRLYVGILTSIGKIQGYEIEGGQDGFVSEGLQLLMDK
jgi:hypothetical protein